MLYGAIIGDIAGSIYEFDPNYKEKPEEIMGKGTFFTDDTVMTIAVANALVFPDLCPIRTYLRIWAAKYPNAGYGSRFQMWLDTPTSDPYYSCGNGAAMRVSPAGWMARDIFEARFLADMVTAPTHNHPEGIKGAEAVASAIFLARSGWSKEDIKCYIEGEFGYEIRTCDEIRPTYLFDETCQHTVPEAIAAFMESEDFEDCIKLAISLGGDSDTVAAIAGSIAEAYYGVPDELIDRCKEIIPQEMVEVIEEFRQMCRERSNY